MRVRVVLSLEVNQEDWNEAYGQPASTTRDARSYVLNMVQTCAAADDGLIESATLMQ